MTSAEDRAAGAIVGTLIGDALGVGPHWYYDLNELRKEYGEWIDDYKAPKPGRYHDGVLPGQGSQTGQVIHMLLESVAEQGKYDQEDFTKRLDTLLDTLDGTPYSGRYTDVAMRDVWRSRKVHHKNWGDEDFASVADTTEAAQRAVILAARYANNLMEAGLQSAENIKLTHADSVIVHSSTAFSVIVGAIIRGVPYNKDFGFALRTMTKNEEIPFTFAVLAEEKSLGLKPKEPSKKLPFPDALLWPGFCIEAANDPSISIEPAWKVSLVYGKACSLSFLFPAAFYLAAKFPNSFENAVLHAVNGGGNNMARAALTGAISGAQVGLSGIPEKFIKGIDNHEQIVKMAKEVARLGCAGLN